MLITINPFDLVPWGDRLTESLGLIVSFMGDTKNYWSSYISENMLNPSGLKISFIIIGPQHEKTCLRRFVNNKGADQTAHSRSLISAFVIRFLESLICKFATGEVSIF